MINGFLCFLLSANLVIQDGNICLFIVLTIRSKKIKNKILITGSDGFIGSHLTEKLVRQGHKVKAFVCYNSFNFWGWLEDLPEDILNEVEIFTGDIRDSYGVKNAMKDCNQVFHLAALIAIPYSYHSPHTYIETNVNGTLNILQAARELSVEKIIHTSTSEVYGTARFVPITEEHPLQGQSPYSASKIAADQLAYSFYCSFSTPVIIARPFNTYGPRQSARAVIPTIITQLVEKSELELGALSPTRDFNYVADTVDGFIALKDCNHLGEVVNIGSNYEISIEDVAKTIAEIMGKNIKITTREERIRPEKSEVERLWADNSKIKKITNWQPQYGGRDGFKKGLQETISWFTEPRNLQKYKTIYNI